MFKCVTAGDKSSQKDSSKKTHDVPDLSPEALMQRYGVDSFPIFGKVTKLNHRQIKGQEGENCLEVTMTLTKAGQTVTKTVYLWANTPAYYVIHSTPLFGSFCMAYPLRVTSGTANRGSTAPAVPRISSVSVPPTVLLSNIKPDDPLAVWFYELYTKQQLETKGQSIYTLYEMLVASIKNRRTPLRGPSLESWLKPQGSVVKDFVVVVGRIIRKPIQRDILPIRGAPTMAEECSAESSFATNAHLAACTEYVVVEHCNPTHDLVSYVINTWWNDGVHQTLLTLGQGNALFNSFIVVGPLKYTASEKDPLHTRLTTMDGVTAIVAIRDMSKLKIVTDHVHKMTKDALPSVTGVRQMIEDINKQHNGVPLAVGGGAATTAAAVPNPQAKKHRTESGV